MLPFGGFLAPLRTHPQLLPLLILMVLVMSGAGIVSPILSLYAATFSIGTTMIGMIITSFGVGRLLADLPAGVLSQRFGRKPLLMAGPAIIVVGVVQISKSCCATPPFVTLNVTFPAGIDVFESLNASSEGLPAVTVMTVFGTACFTGAFTWPSAGPCPRRATQPSHRRRRLQRARNPRKVVSGAWTI